MKSFMDDPLSFFQKLDYDFLDKNHKTYFASLTDDFVGVVISTKIQPFRGQVSEAKTISNNVL
jgi:hypothetical protein